MKKLFALLWICGLCLGLLLYSIFGVSNPPLPVNTDEVPSSSTENHTPDTTPKEPVAQVRVMNPDPSRSAAWERLAAEYSQRTGVEVLVLGNFDPRTPTLYPVTSADELDASQCMDLSGTAAFAQLADMGLALVVDGKYCGIAAEIDCFGLIFNENLLAEMATPEEISDITSFTGLVQGIADKGYTPFAGRGLDDGVATRLASIPGSIRSLAQLWVAHSSSNPESAPIDRFLNGEAVFYLGSTDEYDTIIAGGIEAVGILPIYQDLDGANYRQQSLCVTASRYWCVTTDANEEDVAATLAFLDWLVTPGEDGQVPVDELEILAPYRQATYYANPLEATLRQDLHSGKGLLICRHLTEPPLGFTEALMVYAQNPTDENWDKVEELKQ